MKQPHGSCRLYKAVDVLRIVTPSGAMRKDGTRKLQTHVYLVTNLNPDPRCANPAYKLEKITSQGEAECWEVHVDRYGPSCSCPDRTYRDDGHHCKHIAALKVTGLLPSRMPTHADENTQEAQEQVPDPAIPF